MAGWFTLAIALLLLALSTALQPARAAGGESYDYDGLGRLVRAISSAGVVTEYVYDAAGNITAVIRGGAASPPTLTNVAPASIRRGSQVRVTLTGTNLQNAALQALDRELTISGVTRTATSLAFDLVASAQVALGASALRVSSAAGNATININVRPPLPKVELSPLPIAVPPDGRSATIDLVLSNADDQAHTIALSTVRPDIASVAPASVTIPAGSTRAALSVTGRLGGNTELRLESATLGNSTFPIFVLAAFEGINTARANQVGVTLAAAAQPSTVNGLFAAVPVGVVRANTAWLDTSPRFVSQGGTQTLQITGLGLSQSVAVSVEPADGITLGVPVVAADGRSAAVAVSAAASAAQGARRLVLRAGTSVLTPAAVGADLLDVVAPLPVIVSVQPILLAPASTIPVFEIRGRNLQDATSVQFQGGGVTVGSTLVINPEGTVLQVGLQVSPVAAPGPRTVVVFAPSGNSGITATPANTVSVIPEGAGFQPYPDITAPVVGVVKATAVPPPLEAPYSVGAPAVGMAVGPLVVTALPASISRTETVTLRIQGQFLGSATSVAITPNSGLTSGVPVVRGDGREVSVQLTAAVDAPLGGRRIDLLAGAVPLRVAGSGVLSLVVTPLTPVVDSIEPNSTIPSGIPFELIVRGRNFQGATAVRITPSAGISIGTLAVNPGGTEVKVQVTVAAGAARGARTVTVVAPAGESSSTAGPNNQFTLSDGLAVFDFPSVLVGVQLGSPTPTPPSLDALVSAPAVGVARGSLPPTEQVSTVLAQLIGVTLAGAPGPASQTLLASSSVVGATRGPVTLRVEPAAWVPGQTGVLVVRGSAIPAGSTVQLLPSSAVTLNGLPTVDADGAAIRQSITVGAATTLKTLSVNVLKPDGAAVPFAGPASEPLSLWLTPGLPDVASLETIVARQGDTVSLLIRGTNLGDAIRVTSEPNGGLDFAPDFTVNAAGTELRIQLSVRDDAPLGARVIRVVSRLGGSSSTASPANTFTVFPALLPDVVSLEPILARQGDTVDLVIRGTNLNGALQVTAEPASGIELAPNLTVNAAGTEVRIQLLVRTDAPLGARVFRVFTRFGGSSSSAAPANTFTVFPRN